MFVIKWILEWEKCEVFCIDNKEFLEKDLCNFFGLFFFVISFLWVIIEILGIKWKMFM